MNCCLPLSAKNISFSTLDVEFKIPNNCNGCERDMTDVIANFKGVESCEVDSENTKIAVSGSFNLEKLLKKLMKVTGKEVEIVKEEEKEAEPEIVEVVEEEKHEETEIVQEEEKDVETELEVVMEPNSDELKELEKFMLFSEENPNAKCTIS